MEEVKDYELKPLPCNTKHNLTGSIFGEWKVIGYLGKRYWLCRCSCGKLCRVHSYKLINGDSRSCGHDKNKFIDLTGMTFGEWKVLKYSGNHKWLCQCSCGVVKEVSSIYLRNGKSKSCGHSTTKLGDLTGQKFGEWDVLEYSGGGICRCRCSCGTERLIKSSDLTKGKTKSCGHNTTAFQDLTGRIFGEIKVISYAGNQMWNCVCSCGNSLTVNGQHLRNGHTSSCGCKSAEKARATTLAKYGVEHLSQVHRTTEQIEATSSKENLINVIQTTFTYKPTARELSSILGLTLHRTLTYIHKYELESYVFINYKSSAYEDELNKLFPGGIRRDRAVLRGYEIDLYFPEKHIGLEFNDTYWHSDIMKEPKYHQIKSTIAHKEGIRLIHIFEYEWNNPVNRQILIDSIQKSLGIGEVTILGGRECEVAEVSYAEVKNFLEYNHLQGSVPSSHCIAIKHNSNIVGVMTFGTPRFSGVESDRDYELLRLCYARGIIVQGGSEKLFHYFLSKYNPDKIISYCDISKFSGKVYTRLGFKFKELTTPNYKWISIQTGDILTRYQTQKHILLKKGLGRLGDTEVEIMQNLGYYRVYDCGNAKYIWSKN